MGYEDYRLKDLADKKALKNAIFTIIITAVIFAAAYFTTDTEDKDVTAFVREETSRTETVQLELSKDDEVLTLTEELTILPEGFTQDSEEDEYVPESFLTAYSRKLLSDLNKNSSDSELVLPIEADGVKIKWTIKGEEIPIWILGLGLMLALAIYFSRYDEIKKTNKARKEEFALELPNMAMQYTLMLNAGLISESAFEELIRQNQDESNYLYIVFRALLDKARSTNTSFVYEMYNFSSNFGNKDFLRFSTLCVEHSHRGSELASKLDNERKQLWNGRLSNAKAKAKEAETKLCFPLMLLLLALVLICVAPAFLEM